MSQRYLGGVITANPTLPTLSSASGVWTLEQDFQYSSSITPQVIGSSVRLRSSASAYFLRSYTGGSSPADTAYIKTYSFWTKRGALGSSVILLSNRFDGSNFWAIYFGSDNTLNAQNYASGSLTCQLTTTQVFRDPSAWYHIVVAVDTTQATASNRLKMYVNGAQITAFSTATYMAQNSGNLGFLCPNSGTWTACVGAYNIPSNFYDGYFAEFNVIDGQALTPSSFGAFDGNGIWQPLSYRGTYGTNGFYLTFADNSGATATTLGKDYSGNGNNWTPNNISVTAGVTYDWMLDTPTNSDNGGTGRGNYAVLNPLTLAGSGTGTVTNANLTLTSPSVDSTGAQLAGSIGVSSGQFYWEETFTTLTSGSGYLCAGIQDASVVISGLSGSTRGLANTWWISDDGNYRANGGTVTASGLGAFAAGDVAMIAVDASTGKGWIGKNGTWVGSPSAGTGNTFSSLPATIAPFAQAIRNTTTNSVLNANFGQRPFAYTPPTGFKALNTQNLPSVNINNGAQYMAAVTYTGNSGSQTVSNGVFQPDLTWHKTRSAVASHVLFDAIRGANSGLNSDSTAAQNTNWTGQSFTSTGFTVSNAYSSESNYNGATMVAWQWKAGNTTSSNTNGSITSTVSVNATAGFSVVTYTGSASAATVGHGLGVAPKFLIVKSRSLAGTAWGVWTSAFGGTASSTDYVTLNTTGAKGYAGALDFWNNTPPTSSVFSVGTQATINQNGTTYVAYCWSEVAGYSKFGSYTGNGSADGPFVYCGFRPRFVLIKCSSTGGAYYDWVMYDTSRMTYNVCTFPLAANLSSAESSFTPNYEIDILSNGFKARNAGGNSTNINGATYIYACFAENPFQISRAR